MVDQSGVLCSSIKKSMINGVRVRILRIVPLDLIEVIVLSSYKHYSKNDVMIVDANWFISDSR